MSPRIRVALPCSADWERMRGDDRVRFCDQCNLNVYNFSAMTEVEVLRTISQREGRICGRFYQRADGTMLTKNCPVGFRAHIRRVSRIAGAALSAAMSLGATVFAQAIPKQTTVHVDKKADSIVTVNVMDSSGAIIQKADVVLEDAIRHGLPRRGVTDDKGQVRFKIPTGAYLLAIKSPGFQDYSKPLKMTPGQSMTIEANLEVGHYVEMGVIVAPYVETIPAEDPPGPSRLPSPTQ